MSRPPGTKVAAMLAKPMTNTISANSGTRRIHVAAQQTKSHAASMSASEDAMPRRRQHIEYHRRRFKSGSSRPRRLVDPPQPHARDKPPAETVQWPYGEQTISRSPSPGPNNSCLAMRTRCARAQSCGILNAFTPPNAVHQMCKFIAIRSK